MKERTNSPTPWKVVAREVKANGKTHHKYTTHVIVDANGRDVWMTKTNAELIALAVNLYTEKE